MGSVDTAARAWTSPRLDGQLYGEPLALGDLVYVATEDDIVYALSAATGAIAWSARLGTPVPSKLLPCSNINPIVGITGTPVIDPARREIFVVADELKNGRPTHVLTGLNTASGQVELSQDVDPPGQPPAKGMPLTLAQLLKVALDPRWQFTISQSFVQQASGLKVVPYQ